MIDKFQDDNSTFADITYAINLNFSWWAYAHWTENCCGLNFMNLTWHAPVHEFYLLNRILYKIWAEWLKPKFMQKMKPMTYAGLIHVTIVSSIQAYADVILTGWLTVKPL